MICDTEKICGKSSQRLYRNASEDLRDIKTVMKKRCDYLKSLTYTVLQFYYVSSMIIFPRV